MTKQTTKPPTQPVGATKDGGTKKDKIKQSLPCLQTEERKTQQPAIPLTETKAKKSNPRKCKSSSRRPDLSLRSLTLSQIVSFFLPPPFCCFMSSLVGQI